MPGTIMDALATLAGRPDPSMQLMAYLNQAPGQAGGGPAIAGAPAPSQGQGGGGAPIPAQGAPQAGQGPPQGQGGAPAATMPNGQPAPQAFQSPSDLGQMYLAMAQRQQASENFNRGLGLFAASAYPGRRPDIIMNAMNAPQQDPGEMFGNLMKLQMYNQQQGQYQSFLRAVPDIGKQLNLTPDEVMAVGPSAAATAIQANMPPEAMRNWMYAKRQWVASHPDDPNGAQFEQQFPMSMAITGAIPGLSDTDRQRVNLLGNWQRQNPGQTPPAWLSNTTAFQNYQKDLGDAQGNFSQLNQRSQEAIDTIERIKNNPNLGSALKNLSTTGGFGSNFASQIGAMDPQTKQAMDDIQLLSGQIYGEGFRSTGSRRTGQEVQAIVEGLSKLKQTGYSANDYSSTVLNPVEQRIQKAQANNYGAAQQLDAMPDNLKPLVDPIYMPGGSQYGGQGGKGWYLQGMSKADADAAYDQMAPGTVYVDTDGKTKRKS